MLKYNKVSLLINLYKTRKKFIQMKKEKALTIKTLSKSNVWELQENDIFRLWDAAEKDIDLTDNVRQYTSIIKSAFEIEDIKIDKPEIIAKYEARGFKIGEVKIDNNERVKWAIKKRPIMRVTDLTYDNIHHISAEKLIEILERNFGGGWDSLSQNVKDIITSGFDISTTTLPKDRLHKVGGLYETKVANGFQVLEIEKGTWIEAIFAKEKPEVETIKVEKPKEIIKNEEDDEEDEIDLSDNYDDDYEDELDDEQLTEESYRTTFDTDPEDLDMADSEISDDSDAY